LLRRADELLSKGKVEAKGSALDTGQIEQVIEKNILPAPKEKSL